MFTRKPPNPLQKAIDKLLVRMDEEKWGTDDYNDMLKQLTMLYKLKEQDAPKRISPDTVILVAGNLVGILLILSHERLNVISTKAIGFVLRSR